MSGTQDSIGITPDNNAVPTPDGGGDNGGFGFNNDLRGQRKSSKSAVYPWTADVAVKAKNVKSSDTKPID